ncbi:hypothetical protein [Aliikangiella coralliicola]|uniref:Uncharacterized protein n=1 Tax=Aliikangiella coralliicola TaxID=2592383 RepID=A0A545U632_9GAMM|nr:hypothetical protein [Aliikangiella coralliicola]TQV84927.1 hypothetical protein FLL46_21265 [Aliikangiella coralliicola]
MKWIIKILVGLFSVIFVSGDLAAQSFLSYTFNVEDNVLRGQITRHYMKVQDPTSCDFYGRSSIKRGDQCEPVIKLIPPAYPEIHFFVNDSLAELLKYQASKGPNGLIIKKLSLNANDKELSKYVKEGRAEIKQNLKNFADDFQAANGGNRTIPIAKMTINGKPDCTQGEGNELMDSSLDVIKRDINSYFQQQIKAGNYPVFERRQNGVRQINASISLGKDGVSGTAGGGYAWSTGQYSDIKFSDGGIARYVFDGEEPYLDLDNSYTPPLGALNTSIRFSNFFSRTGKQGPVQWVGHSLIDEKDSCFFKEIETTLEILDVPVTDQRGTNAGFAGQCTGSNSYGNMVEFSYWVQTARFSGGKITISMRKISVRMNRHEYSQMCR